MTYLIAEPGSEIKDKACAYKRPADSPGRLARAQVTACGTGCSSG
jgi:hypothetical protein